MAMDLTRRAFFTRGLRSFLQTMTNTSAAPVVAAKPPQTPLLRPPGAGSEEQFLARCSGCGDCIAACPANALVEVEDPRLPGGRSPVLRPWDQACVWCDEFPCIAACEPAALIPANGLAIGVASIDKSRCFAWAGQPCDYCYDRCPFPGTALTLEGGRIGVPVVHDDACVGCGMCEYICLTTPAAIRVQRQAAS